MQQDANNLVWLDLEMTGLDPDTDRIIEIATVVTDSELNVLAEGPELAIWQPEDVLLAMDEWNTEQHGRSGLVERVRRSEHREADAERLTLQFLGGYLPGETSPICGNSICQDRRFLHRRMPALERFFHYRNLDVSALKELCRRWAPELAAAFTKSATHRALQDVHDSIAELRFYREHFLRVGPGRDLAASPARG
jgi:oligoribonuclease